MLKTIDALEKGFQATAEKTRKECGNKLEKLRKFIFGIQGEKL